MATVRSSGTCTGAEPVGARYRPTYLAHVSTRRLPPGQTFVVVLKAPGRALLPAHVQWRLADVEATSDVRLGLVAPRKIEPVDGRQRVLSWGYNRWGHSDDGGSGAHYSRREAAESCAVEAIEGPAARQRFNASRSSRRRSSSGVGSR